MVHHLLHRPDDILSLVVDDRNDLDQIPDTGIDDSDDRHVVHQIDLDLHCAGADNYNITYSYEAEQKKKRKNANRINLS